jgi:hypothetical protein
MRVIWASLRLTRGADGWMPRPQSSAAVLTCPETHARTTLMALKETTTDLARASAALNGPDQENAIRIIAAELKRRHPQAGSAEIVNYLLSAYCPIVKKESGLSDREKRERMDQFSTQVLTIVR